MAHYKEEKIDHDDQQHDDPTGIYTKHPVLDDSLLAIGTTTNQQPIIQPSCQALVDQLQIISMNDSVRRSLGSPSVYSWMLDLDKVYSYNYPSFYHQIIALHPPWASICDYIVQKGYSPVLYAYVNKECMILMLSTRYFKKKCRKLRAMDPTFPLDDALVQELRITLYSIPQNCIVFKRDKITRKYQLQLNTSSAHRAKHQHLADVMNNDMNKQQQEQQSSSQSSLLLLSQDSHQQPSQDNDQQHQSQEQQLSFTQNSQNPTSTTALSSSSSSSSQTQSPIMSSALFSQSSYFPSSQTSSLPTSQTSSQATSSSSMLDDDDMADVDISEFMGGISCLELPHKSDVLRMICDEYELDTSAFEMITSDYYADIRR